MQFGMNYYYKVFGLICESEVELPAFGKYPNPMKIDFRVKVTQKNPGLTLPILGSEEGCSYNETEFSLEVENTAKYLVRDGSEILIEPMSEDWKSILLFFYSNCMGALLFQKNLIPFHVSGILDKKGKVWLFAAPSQSGKSTTVLKLKERGYDIFTDDTALIFVKDGKCWAIPSYPMIKVWKNTLNNQAIFKEENAIQLHTEIEKYGVFFHQEFQNEPREVNGIVFLGIGREEICIKKIGQIEALADLGSNIYRGHWVIGMKKQITQFKVLTSLVKHTHFWKADRPKNKNTFDSFSNAIKKEILEN